jgi:hypothetical protein
LFQLQDHLSWQLHGGKIKVQLEKRDKAFIVDGVTIKLLRVVLVEVERITVSFFGIIPKAELGWHRSWRLDHTEWIFRGQASIDMLQNAGVTIKRK